MRMRAFASVPYLTLPYLTLPYLTLPYLKYPIYLDMTCLPFLAMALPYPRQSPGHTHNHTLVIAPHGCWHVVAFPIFLFLMHTSDTPSFWHMPQVPWGLHRPQPNPPILHARHHERVLRGICAAVGPAVQRAPGPGHALLG